MLLQFKLPNLNSNGNEETAEPRLITNCTRCGGLLEKTYCVSPDQGTCDFQIPVARCLQCGDVIDPVILKHRFSVTLPDPKPNKRRQWANVQAISNT